MLDKLGRALAKLVDSGLNSAQSTRASRSQTRFAKLLSVIFTPRYYARLKDPFNDFNVVLNVKIYKS